MKPLFAVARGFSSAATATKAVTLSLAIAPLFASREFSDFRRRNTPLSPC
jgi:hypothetical protein